MNQSPEFDDARQSIEAIKQKLRYWIVDHAGLAPSPELALEWAIALEETAQQIRNGSHTSNL
ncbi:hypothetical protein ACQ4M4_12870 [Leptolyngbya sp. AN02str]|uniref:hypothetical protein n=1 Tax=Leptolyngbya sp. AN02str TaxID=3423363 RepID=UPI003D318C6F